MNNYETVKKYTVILHVELHVENVTEITNFLDNGWYMVDYTPSHIVLEQNPFTFEGTLFVLKKYTKGMNDMVAAIADENGLVYTDKEGWF